MANVKNIANQKFGRLTAIKCIGSNKHRNRVWECKCDCGNVKNVPTADLLSGNTRSCGCLHDEGASERFGKHYGTGTILYRTWKNMKQRCYNPSNKKYNNYGGKGVKICDEWLNDFGNFQEWSFQNSYEEGLTIERKDPSGNYEQSNCKWIPFSEQYINKCNAIRIIINGNEHYLRDLAEEYKIPYITLWQRYKKGWDLNDLLKPPRPKKKHHN